ncbi:type IV pilin [Methanogenium cariaci]
MSGSIQNAIHEEGVSETIGVVLLIGLVVVGVSLIGVFFFSQPVAEELPAVDILLSNNGSTILFQHNGGDSLAEDEFRIYVGGNAVAATELSFIDGGNWPWSVGETIQYTATGPITPLDENVLIAHREEKGILLRPTFVDITGTSTDLADVASAPLPTLSPGVGPGSTTPEDAGGIVAASVLADSEIVVAVSSFNWEDIVGGRYFNFTVASSNSTMNIAHETGVRNFNTEDKIVIRTNDWPVRSRISITGVGNTFFSLRFENVNVWIENVAITRPLPPYDVVDIESAWIPEYEDLESTLAFELDPTYELYINGTLDPRGSTTAITLNNVRPTDSGMFVINVRDWNIEPNSVILAKADITE